MKQQLSLLDPPPKPSSHVPSVANYPHYVYLIRRGDEEYVGISGNLAHRLQSHKEPDTFMCFKTPTRREAEGVEATFHELQRQGYEASELFDKTFFLLHSLWFHSGCKGFPKHLQHTTPYLRF